MLVKICGLTQPEDAQCAHQEGAAFLGLIFAKSPRQVSLEQAETIIQSVGNPKKFVAVFVNQSLSVIQSVLTRLNLKWVQLHGDEPNDLGLQLKGMGYSVIKALRIGGLEDLKTGGNYPADYLLLDSYSQAHYGGTGKPFDWNILKQETGIPSFFLSGGISPENVERAIREVNPFGVDASSSLEKSPGIKDAERIRLFFKKIHQAVHA